jgi:hypothetical protein
MMIEGYRFSFQMNLILQRPAYKETTKCVSNSPFKPTQHKHHLQTMAMALKEDKKSLSKKSSDLIFFINF